MIGFELGLGELKLQPLSYPPSIVQNTHTNTFKYTIALTIPHLYLKEERKVKRFYVLERQSKNENKQRCVANLNLCIVIVLSMYKNR